MSGAQESKRQKTVRELFFPGTFDHQAKDEFKRTIASSEPYKHGVIPNLMDDSLLRQVRNEILSHLHFTEKETDIYKVFQTGDLANLSGLDESELSKLRGLAQVREALYSKEFRDHLSYVTDSGPLSGCQQDLSINIYSKGCHLLNHDDVIGTRRISYILYLVEPPSEHEGEGWLPKWGGALRLFPTDAPNVPRPDWTLSIPPKWNQLSFFKVQPGLSFHDVEEVYVDKPRLAISGWFHTPQQDEPGYQEMTQKETHGMSSLKQLETFNSTHDFPKRVHVPFKTDTGGPLDASDKEFLKQYINEEYLDPTDFGSEFLETSKISLTNFLCESVALQIKEALDQEELECSMPQTYADIKLPWQLARPSHKYRYMYLEASSENESPNPKSASTEALSKVIQELLQHPSFNRWLQALTSLTPRASSIIGRRFRPGLDYTLATAQGSAEPVLDATLDLTPTKGWDSGKLGGYEACMIVDENDKENDDPAVYKSNDTGEQDSTAVTQVPEWNSLTIILRDDGVLKFVKYVSRSAPGSRWDISGEWTVE